MQWLAAAVTFLSRAALPALFVAALAALAAAAFGTDPDGWPAAVVLASSWIAIVGVICRLAGYLMGLQKS